MIPNDSYPTAPVRTFVVLWFACMALTAVAAWLLGSGVAGIDDAYIFFVYADNLANGHGLVYNPGGERVEGFSSFAWVLVLAALFRSGLGIAPVFIVTSLLAASGLYALLSALPPELKRAGKGFPLLIVLSAAWMLAAPGWHLWNIASLMDLALWACLLSWAIALFIRSIYAETAPNMKPLALVYGLLILTRPEAMAWVPFFLLSLALLARYRSFGGWQLVGLPLVVSLLALGGLVVFRLSYFGHPLPNTYYAKVSPDFFYNLAGGVRYLVDYLTGAGFAALGVLTAIVVFAVRLPSLVMLMAGRPSALSREQFAGAFLAAAVVVALLITIVKGGDHFGGARFLKPIYAWVLLLLAYVCVVNKPHWLARSLQPGRALLSVLLLAILFTAPLRGAWFNIDRTGIWQEFEVAREGRATAARLDAYLQAAAVTELPMVGVTGAGGFNYEWRGEVFDLMGLNDVRLAHTEDDRKGDQGHAAFDPDVFFDRRPEIILPHIEGWPGLVTDCVELQAEEGFYWRVLDGLQAKPEFTATYRFIKLEDPAGALCMYVRRDYAAGSAFSD